MGKNRCLIFVGSLYVAALPDPENIPVSIIHSIFVKGDMMNYDLKEDDVEVSMLYPDVEYTTTDQLLDMFLAGNPPPLTHAAFA